MPRLSCFGPVSYPLTVKARCTPIIYHLESDHNVLPTAQHQAAYFKGPTNPIERFKNTLRQRLERLVRKTLAFFKCPRMHELVIQLFLHRYNLEHQNILT